jgi:TonB-linked SusC/RagA family outer membrane protein
MENTKPMHRTRICFTALLLTGFCISGSGQAGDQPSVEVQGTVLDASSKLPLNGITISVPGFSSAYSDSLGQFTIQVPHDQSALQISGPGYQSRDVLLKGREQVSIGLNEAGYHSQDELAQFYYLAEPLAFTTQSVVSVNVREETWKRPGTSAEKVLNNGVAGLRILARSGVPGIGSNLFLRGFSSLYSTNQPLIVLDGLIYETSQYGKAIINGFQTNPLNSININDIENITLIRDAASIYGSRAGNGVLYIRTNHPYQMATRIDFSMYGGINFAPEQLPLLKSQDYRDYLSEILQTSGITADSIQSMPFMIDDPSYSQYYRYHNETNWQDEVFTNSTNRNVNLKITGGDDIALYALSVGYQNNQGIIRETDYSRYSFRFNSNINISNKLQLATNLGFTFNQHTLKEDGDAPNTNPLHTSLIKAPFLYPNVRSSSGAISPNLEDADIFGVGNPKSMIQNLSASSNNYKILGSVDLSYKFSDHLMASNYLGINFDKSRDNLFVPYLGIAQDTIEQGIVGNKVAHKVDRYFNVYNDLRINYVRSLNWRHNLSGLAGVRFGINKTQGDWGMDYNTPNDQIRTLGNGVSSMREVSGYFGDWNWVTFYARAGYDYNHKYLVDFNLALDGSSRFGKEADGLSMFGGTFGFFPSVSGAWLISSESFMQAAGFIDLLKLRISYGITGNDNIGNYTATKYYVSQNLLGSEGLVKGNLYNPALKWETNKKLNGGLDISLFGDRLFLRADLYRNLTDGLINIIAANPLSGFDSYIDNNGSFTSTGLDFSLDGRILNGSLKWDAGIILSKYKTNLVDFPEESRITTIYGANIISQKGQPINQFYGYRTLGVFATQAEAEASGLRALMPNTDLVPFSAGDVHFEDLNGDQIIDVNDMQVIGDPNPDLTGMITSSLSWKGISFDIGMNFSYGNDVFNHLRYRMESMKNADNQTPLVLNRWRGEGQVTNVPKAVWGDPIGNSRFSDLWIEDGSYMRLSYVSLSYKIPVIPRFVSSVEIFVSGNNLLTLTSYMGLDPDFSLSGATLSQGIDIGLTPQPRSVYAGIRIGL